MMTDKIHLQIETKWFEHGLLGDEKYSKREAYAWLLKEIRLRARFKEYQTKTIAFKHNQMAVGYRELCIAWGWGNNSIKKFLSSLIIEGFIAIDTTYGWMLLTLVELTVKPVRVIPSQPQEIKPVKVKTKEIKPITPTIKPKPVKQNNEIDKQFQELWTAYKPYNTSKGSKATALIAFKKALRKAPYDKIISGCKVYITDSHKNTAYTKHTATWLNQEGWDIEPTVSPEQASSDSEFDQMYARIKAEAQVNVN